MKFFKSKKMYILSALLLIIGIGLTVTFFIKVMDSGEGDLRLVVPGSKTVFLEEGNYTIFHEYSTNFEGKIYHTNGEISGLTMGILEMDTNDHVQLKNSISSSYHINGTEAESIFKFEITEPGDYMIFAAYDDGSEGSDAVISVKRGFMENLFMGIVGIISGIGFIFISLILAVIVFILRYNEKKTENTIYR